MGASSARSQTNATAGTQTLFIRQLVKRIAELEAVVAKQQADIKAIQEIVASIESSSLAATSPKRNLPKS